MNGPPRLPEPVSLWFGVAVLGVCVAGCVLALFVPVVLVVGVR